MSHDTSTPAMSPAKESPMKVADVDRPDVEAYVGRALRLMAAELHPELARRLPNDPHCTTGDPYDILRCLTDHANWKQLPELGDQSVLSAAYRIRELRNQWAHPCLHEPMEPERALEGIAWMIHMVQAFERPPAALEDLREDLRAASGSATGPGDVTSSLEGEALMDLDDFPTFDEGAITARMTLRPGTGPAYEAAAVVRREAFETEGSIFGARTPIWTAANLDSLLGKLLDEKEGGLDAFIARYTAQLVGSTREVVQLAAEALYVHLLINAKSISGATKRSAIDRVLSCHPECAGMPTAIAGALDMGLVRTGAWFHQWRWRYLATVISTALDIRHLPASDQCALWEDPWCLRDWLMRDTQRDAQRHALLHLLDPDIFEAIISLDDKKQILEKFGDLLPHPAADVDRGLSELRLKLAPEFGPRYDYYRPPVVELWR